MSEQLGSRELLSGATHRAAEVARRLLAGLQSSLTGESRNRFQIAFVELLILPVLIYSSEDRTQEEFSRMRTFLRALQAGDCDSVRNKAFSNDASAKLLKWLETRAATIARKSGYHLRQEELRALVSGAEIVLSVVVTEDDLSHMPMQDIGLA